MALQPIQQTQITPAADMIIARLDAIMHELQTLRQAILVSQPQPPSSIVDQLWGALGQGTPEELNELQEDIYLEIFDDESAH